MLVKAFNNIFFKHLLALARPAGATDRSYLPIAGDSAPAKAAVTEFIESIGYGVVDAGRLADSRRQATGTPVWGTPYGQRPELTANTPDRPPRPRWKMILLTASSSGGRHPLPSPSSEPSRILRGRIRRAVARRSPL
ncbi:NAD(P)-binding domain-containing protein [Actinoallomurus rhizosphaericola]|uniref:hypothetical protein n=1 Tax=Actinoallomurus rhizosphaericola TaxID=2952536 RepID=UPI002092E287|nr:hypothetical protein [Actinoallomurus rhizosphaericola]MCO6000083.1 hypothetical protein [Actinoallomurus rhizosphaericola]